MIEISNTVCLKTTASNIHSIFFGEKTNIDNNWRMGIVDLKIAKFLPNRNLQLMAFVFVI